MKSTKKTNKNNGKSLPFEKKAEIGEEAMKVFHVQQDEMHSSPKPLKKEGKDPGMTPLQRKRKGRHECIHSK